MDEVVDDVVVELARETLKGDVRDFLLDRLKHDKNPLPWDSQSEAAQRETISQAERAAERLIEKVAEIVRGEGRVVVEVALEQVVVKDGVKAVVSCPKTLNAIEHLGAAQGSTVALVFVSTEHLQGQRKPRFVKPDQAAFFDEDTGTPLAPPEDAPVTTPENTPEPPPVEEPKAEEPPPPPPEDPEVKDGPKDEPEVARAKRRGRK